MIVLYKLLAFVVFAVFVFFVFDIRQKPGMVPIVRPVFTRIMKLLSVGMKKKHGTTGDSGAITRFVSGRLLDHIAITSDTIGPATSGPSPWVQSASVARSFRPAMRFFAPMMRFEPL